MADPKPLLAVGAIVIERGELLLVRRGAEPSKGDWSLPGGKVEWGETVREALTREVREETGIDVDLVGLAGMAERIIPDDDGEVVWHYVIHDFWARPRSHELKPGDDVDDARWVAVGDLAEMKLSPGLYEFLQDRGALEGRIPRLRGTETIEPHSGP